MEVLTVISEQNILGKVLRIYGTKENPLILAKDVAEWIEHSNPRMMLKSVDEDEKQCVNNPYALKGQQEQWFLTEDGVYEVLMQSRKPIAKEWKREVKKALKQIRLTGGYIPINENESEEDIMAKALLIAQRTIDKKNAIIEYQKPMVELAEERISKKGCFSITDVTKTLGLKRGDNNYGRVA